MHLNEHLGWIVGFVACVGFSGLAAEPAKGELIGYYPFEGNANDASGHGHHGTLENVVLSSDGYRGMAYEFSGSGGFQVFDGSYISVPININPSVLPQLTMGAWVRPDFGNADTGRLDTVLSHDDGNYDRSLLFENREGQNGWSAFAGPAVHFFGSVPVVADEWVFLAVVYDQPAQQIRLYVNDTELVGSGLLGTSEHEFTHIGGNPGFGVRFKGLIDEVFFFDTALTSEEIEDIRERGIPEPAGLLLWLVGWAVLGGRSRRNGLTDSRSAQRKSVACIQLRSDRRTK